MSIQKKSKIKKESKLSDLLDDPKSVKKSAAASVDETTDEHENEDGAGIIPAVIDGEEPAIAGDETDSGFHPSVALADEETVETPDEVSLDDLTDDEREMLGLEAKPKVNTDDESETANTGASWEEFGYEQEELE